MVRSIGAQIGLLAFAVGIVAGIYAGNSATVVLVRALLAMLIGAAVGQAVGWAVKALLRDHLQRHKLRIDDEHFKAVSALTPPGEAEEAVPEVKATEAG